MSRSLAACEGAVLVVDASQGVEAQTVANCYTAIEQGVEVIPVLNKIDLPSADAGEGHPGDRGRDRHPGAGRDPRQRQDRRERRRDPRGRDRARAAAAGDPTAPLQALIIDSWFDNYVGVVMLVRVMEGTLRPKDRILLMSTGATYLCDQVGVFTPKAKRDGG